MKKIIITLLSVTGICVCLSAQAVNEYDNGYIVSVKKNKCIKVKDYMDKNVRPSELLKDPACEISALDDSIKSLIITCTNKSENKIMMYSYTMSLETCEQSLKIARKRLLKK